jgi:hypothetical protein
MTWLLGLVGGRKWMAYIVLIVAVCACVASLYGSGYWHGYTANERSNEIKLLTDQLEAERGKVSQLETQRDENKQLGDALGQQQAQARVVYEQVRAEARSIVQPNVLVPGAVASSSVCGVSSEFVRLWNRAIAPDMPSTTARVLEATASTGAVESIALQDALDNHIDNAEREHSNRQQCNALIEWHHSHDNNNR